MDVREATALIRDAVPSGAATWADLGAGAGTFTMALASLLGLNAMIIAVDRDQSALVELRRAVKDAALGATVVPLHADFQKPMPLPPLDGALLANALHFVSTREQADVLARIAAHVRPHGRLVIVDYDGRAANPWVPFPVSSRRLGDLLQAIGAAAPAVVGRQPSRYGGTIYAAWSAVSGAMSATSA
jgi:SAM-dependent methyltransferase